MSNYGFVYILCNDAMPNIFKIGYTDRAPLQRADELSNSTSVPMPFQVVFYIECSSPKDVESEIHGEFDKYRLSKNREFFWIKISNLINDVIPYLRSFSQNETYCMQYQYYQALLSKEVKDIPGLMLGVKDE
jgi:hypothetical protein